MSFVYWELIASKYQARILPQVFWVLKFSITDRRGKKAGMSEKAEVPTPGYHPGPVPVLFTFHRDQCPDFFNKWLSREKRRWKVKREYKNMSIPYLGPDSFF